MADTKSNWLLVNHLDNNGTGTLTAVSAANTGDNFTTTQFSDTQASGKPHAPWFLGIQNQQAILFDPISKEITLAESMPGDAFPAYSYQDPHSNHIWFMNDGDKDSGNDTLNCGDKGSTVTIIDKGDETTPPKHVKTLCVGRGHHVTTFIAPCENFPDLPKVAYVSNLVDGSISVVGNDPTDSENYLNILQTINLCAPDKEKDGTTGIPNNAFPHGKQFSEVTGKIYSLNNGYGLVDVINPATHTIEHRIPFKGYSNLLLSRCGKYLIGKGADRKSDAAHVLGNLAVIDAKTYKVVTEFNIPDLYPSTYRFNLWGDKLYVTSAATGKGEQKDNLSLNTLYVYDSSQLPALTLIKAVEVGIADCGRRPIAFPSDINSNLVFVPNPTDGTLSIVDGESNNVIDTLTIASHGGNEFNFSFWQSSIYGA